MSKANTQGVTETGFEPRYPEFLNVKGILIGQLSSFICPFSCHWLVNLGGHSASGWHGQGIFLLHFKRRQKWRWFPCSVSRERWRKDDFSIMVSIFINVSASLLQPLRRTRAGCIPAFQAVFPLAPYLLMLRVPCPSPLSSLVCSL